MTSKQQETVKKLTLFALTWPIFIEMMLHMLMGTVDTFMLSQYSQESVAAVGVSVQIMNMVNIMFNLVAAGTTVLVSRSIGARLLDQAHRIAGTSLVMNLGIGLLLSFILVIASEPALRLIGIEESLLPEAKTYLMINGVFIFIQALLMTSSAILKSHGFTRNTMFITIGMNVINAFGNYLVLFGPFGIPVLGVPGIAVVAVVSRTIALIAMIVLLYRKAQLPFTRDIFRPVKEHITGLLKIGIPSAGENLSFNIMNLVVTGFILQIGTVAYITRVYSMNLMFYIMLIALAVGQGTQILVARMVGAGELQLAYKRGLKSLYIGMASSFIAAIVFTIFGEPLFRIFTDDPDIIALGKKLLMISIILETGRAFNIVLINSLRAVGDVRFPVYMAIWSMWGISVPVGYLLGIHLGYGLVGIFIGFAMDEWARGLCMLWRWRRRRWMDDLALQARQSKAAR